jgi:hypothetical protein
MSTPQHAVGATKREDLELLVKYVKSDLFPSVKFIYDAKVDLAVGGRIYVHYRDRCRKLLSGNRGQASDGQDTYMEMIWIMAMTKHVQKNALAQKRSAVYTVMQNKFVGKFALGYQRMLHACSDY